MKKKFVVFCVILCLASCFVFPASAASTTPISSIYYPMVYNSVGDVQIGLFGDAEHVYGDEVQINNTDFRVTYSHSYDKSDFNECNIGALFFTIALDERLLNYSSDEYSLHVSYRTGPQDKSAVDPEIGGYYDLLLDSNDTCPKIFGITNFTTNELYRYSDDKSNYNFDETEFCFYNSYTFTGAAMDAALSSDMSFGLPIFLEDTNGYVDLEISITTLDGTPVELSPSKPTLGTGIVASLVDTIGAFLAGVGGNIVAVFNAIVMTESGTLSYFAIWSLVFLGVGLAGGVIAAILRKIG